MNGQPLKWVALHLVPLVAVPVVTHTFAGIAGLNTAAALALLTMIAILAIGQSKIMTGRRVSSSRWMWQTACAIGIAVAAGLVVMSTVDLAGYDALATFSGMTSAGLALGLVQAPMLEDRKLQWVALSAGGWLLGALIFRAIISSLAAISIGGLEPYGLAYNAGHNELLWTATGLAFYGFLTLPMISTARDSQLTQPA
jgi:hypothetical protein